MIAESKAVDLQDKRSIFSDLNSGIIATVRETKRSFNGKRVKDSQPIQDAEIRNPNINNNNNNNKNNNNNNKNNNNVGTVQRSDYASSKASPSVSLSSSVSTRQNANPNAKTDYSNPVKTPVSSVLEPTAETAPDESSDPDTGARTIIGGLTNVLKAVTEKQPNGPNDLQLAVRLTTQSTSKAVYEV